MSTGSATFVAGEGDFDALRSAGTLATELREVAPELSARLTKRISEVARRMFELIVPIGSSLTSDKQMAIDFGAANVICMLEMIRRLGVTSPDDARHAAESLRQIGNLLSQDDRIEVAFAYAEALQEIAQDESCRTLDELLQRAEDPMRVLNRRKEGRRERRPLMADASTWPTAHRQIRSGTTHRCFFAGNDSCRR